MPSSDYADILRQIYEARSAAPPGPELIAARAAAVEALNRRAASLLVGGPPGAEPGDAALGERLAAVAEAARRLVAR